MIRKAKNNDIPQIMEIVRDSISIMQAQSNPQWDDVYPSPTDFSNDIVAGTLYVYEVDSTIGGFACINQTETPEYASVAWSLPGRATIIHRMAIAVSQRGKRLGEALFLFAEELATQNKTSYLKTDTYSLNPAMNGLLQKRGYALCGHVFFRGRPAKFNCYEKVLDPK